MKKVISWFCAFAAADKAQIMPAARRSGVLIEFLPVSSFHPKETYDWRRQGDQSRLRAKSVKMPPWLHTFVRVETG
jgi:hypothetical protein